MASYVPGNGDEEVSLELPLVQLAKDLREASAALRPFEARYVVDTYYQAQHYRIQAGAQKKASEKHGEPHRLVSWIGMSMNRFESALRSSLAVFANTYRLGNWLQAHVGVGPVLAAAMLANLDIRHARTVGHFWRFCGLDPTCKWEKGKKRPWNARMKSICAFKLGECFVKFQNHKGPDGQPDCFYGQLFAAKKAALTAQNESGGFREQAQQEMARAEANGSAAKMRNNKTRKIKDLTGAEKEVAARWSYWEQGKLCPAHVHDRARRWTVKLFMSHMHHVMYWDYFRQTPPAPYVFEHPELGDHRHLIDPPLFDPETYRATYEGKDLRELVGQLDD